MEQKKQLADSFGTSKQKRKVNSMMTNKLDENGITNRDNKGINDQRLQEKANEI